MMKIKINNEALAKSLGFRVGEVVDVECRQGVPVNKEWRNRIKDAVIDNCVTVMPDKTTKKGDK